MSNPSNPEIQKRVVELIGGYAGVADVQLSHTIEALGFDSLDLVEVVMELEDEFEIEIPDEDAEKFTTVDSVVIYISEKFST